MRWRLPTGASSGERSRTRAKPCPIGALLGVVSDAGASDGDIEAFVADFLANYVPPADDEEEEGQATETVEVGGRNIRYLKRGEGEGVPVILIHGFGGDLNNWMFNHEAPCGQAPGLCLGLAGARCVVEGRGQRLRRLFRRNARRLYGCRRHRERTSRWSLYGRCGRARLRSRPCEPGVASLTLIGSAGLGSEIDGAYLEGFITAERRKDLKPHVEKLFGDPALVTRQLINDLLAFKRIDGVDGALRTVSGAFAPGGTQALVLKDKLAGLDKPVLAIWGCQGRDHSCQPRRGPAGRRACRGLGRLRPYGANGGRGRRQSPDRRVHRRIRARISRYFDRIR